MTRRVVATVEDIKDAINSIQVIFVDGEFKVQCSLPADQIVITHDNFDLMTLLAQELNNAGMEAKYLEEEASGGKNGR